MDYFDAGQYTVTVSNPSGSLSSETRLQVGQIAYWGGVRGYDDAYYPVDPPPALTNVISIAAGRDFGMAITGDGIPHMWLYRNELRFPFWVTGVIGSSAGSYAGLILRDTGDVYLRNEHSWALPDKGANTQDIVAISGGATHYLALTTRGTVRAWRDDSFHPGDIPADLERVVAVAAGEGHSLALQDDGTVVAWGDNTMGQTNVPSGLSNVVGITAGGHFSVALTEGGKVVSWGAAPPPPPGLEGVIRIAAGRAHVLALRADGTVLSWGSQTNVPPGLHNVLAISTREDFNLALVGDRPPPLGIALEDPIMTPQGVSVTFPTTSGHVYRLEYRDTWSDAWHPLPLIAGNSRQRTATDPSPTSQTRFYRVRQW